MIAMLLCMPGASAVSVTQFPLPSVVTTNDTFQMAILGYNTSETTAVYLVTPITPTFNGAGTAQTFTGAALGSQTVTVTTTQTITGSNVTDSLSLSVPTNFIPTGTTTSAGNVINGIELDLGFNSAGTNTLDFTPAITGTPTYTGSAIYGAANTPLTLTPQPTLTNNGNGTSSLSFYEAVQTTNANGLSQFAIKQFNFSMTYAVPEPSTWALSTLGLVGCATVILRRRRAQV